MTQTVTALYDTYDSAISAVNDLEAYGIPHSDISLVSTTSTTDMTRIIQRTLPRTPERAPASALRWAASVVF